MLLGGELSTRIVGRNLVAGLVKWGWAVLVCAIKVKRASRRLPESRSEWKLEATRGFSLGPVGVCASFIHTRIQE
jgi:hypothetical protein